MDDWRLLQKPPATESGHQNRTPIHSHCCGLRIKKSRQTTSSAGQPLSPTAPLVRASQRAHARGIVPNTVYAPNTITQIWRPAMDFPEETMNFAHIAVQHSFSCTMLTKQPATLEVSVRQLTGVAAPIQPTANVLFHPKCAVNNNFRSCQCGSARPVVLFPIDCLNLFGFTLG